jgi:hypothetical protein
MVESVMQLLGDSIFLFIDAVLFVFLIIFISGLCQKGPQKSGIIKGMEKMLSTTEKGRIPEAPHVEDRQTIITRLFESKMQAIGLTPSTDSGHIPVSFSPLAVFLRDRGVPEDIVAAIITGLKEEETEEDVMNIIDAAADTPDISLQGPDLEKAQNLAVEEWKREKRASAS